MHQAVVSHNVVKMHAQPDPDSEQVSQTVLGHTVTIAESSSRWTKIQTDDGYLGWVRSSQIRCLQTDEHYPTPGKRYRVKALWALIQQQPHPDASHLTIAPLGSWLEGHRWQDDWLQVRLPNGDWGWVNAAEVTEQWVTVNRVGSLRVEGLLHTRGQMTEPYVVPRPGWQNALVYTARRLLGIPYLWGGCSPFGLDCSGFVQLVYRLCGLVIPRDADLQAAYERCAEVALHALQPGDLLFFAGGNDPHHRQITHVGMVIDENHFIHAAGGIGVTITPIEEPSYRSILWGVRRVVDSSATL